jgi:replicative DNA helicase
LDNISVEKLVLSHLLTDAEYCRKVLPYLKPEYFGEYADRLVFEVVKVYVEKFGPTMNRDALRIDLKSRPGLTETSYREADSVILGLTPERADHQWMLNSTEEFCKKRAMHNALIKSAEIIEGDKTNLLPEAIPELLSEALAVGFDNTVGHDYFDDAMKRFDANRSAEERIPFDIDHLNSITNGGVPRKTLNVIIAGTNVGKTLAMCHMAAANLRDGWNVLYITLEMSERSICNRIDANLMDVDLNDIDTMTQDDYMSKLKRVKDTTTGRLKIKEFPTAGASAVTFRNHLKELKIKQDFVPDVIYLDYINLCLSSRATSDGNSYTVVKNVAEEVRGLAVESNVALFTATQFNREGMKSNSPDLTNTSESMGLPFTADCMLGFYTDDNLIKRNVYGCVQMKNRYSNKAQNSKFFIGVDYTRMRLLNVDDAIPVRQAVQNSQRPDSRLSSFLASKLNS